MIVRVTTRANGTLKRLRSLREKKYREREGLFLAEGLRICTEALDHGFVPAILLFAEGRERQPLVHRLVEAALAARAIVIETTADILASVSGKDNPQMVVAAYERRLAALDDCVPGARTLVADRLRDPGNLGTLLRSCDATATKLFILLDECADPTSPEAVRASMGACFTVQAVQTSTALFLQWKARHRARLFGAALDPAAAPYRATDYAPPALLALGNEAHGLSPLLLQAADALVKIPMLGQADSLNVAMAGTLLLYEALHRQGG